MNLLVPLALAGAAFFAISKGKHAASAPKEFKAVELPKELTDRISAAGASSDPALIVSVHDELRAHPLANEPQVKFAADFLMNRLNQMQPKVNLTAGRSGHSYQLQLVTVFSDGARMYDVFTPSGSRIFRFRQQLNDSSSRKFIDGPPNVDAAILKAAKEDFQVA